MPPTRVLRAVYLQAPETTGISERDLWLKLSAGLAEASEILGSDDSADGVSDCPCHVEFRLRRPVRTVSWAGEAKSEQGRTDRGTAHGNGDVQDETDYNQVLRILNENNADIAIVNRIEYCKSRDGISSGPAQEVVRTPYLGCAYDSRKFMIAASSLGKCQDRGLVVAHEYGHNAGNADLSNPVEATRVMFREANARIENQRVVSELECRKFRAWTSQGSK